MNRIASRALALFLIVAVLAGGVVFFLIEYLIKSDDWIVFPGSPHVYNGGNIGCGVVVDREGKLLLDLNDGRTYSNSLPLRQSTVHWVGDRYGSVSAPSLSYYAAQMAGYDLINGVYNYGQSGGVAESTLSSTMQMAALEALGEYKGTVAVYNYKTGQLLCGVTTPTYDPDNVPEFTEGDPQYEGLYVNRFLQSAYIPGSIFKIVTLAAALEHDPAIADQKFTCTGTLQVGDQEVTCEDPHWEQTLKEAFCNSCNCAFAEIALAMGKETYAGYVEQFGITQAITFDGITTAEGNFEIYGGEDINLAWSSVGQHRDLVNPCGFLTFISAIANEGKTTQPYLVEQISVNNNRTYDARTHYGERILSAKTARVVQEYMQNNVTVKYGAENFNGLTVGAKTGTGEVDGGNKPNAMLAGFVKDENLPLAFIVCVEDAGYGRAVCVPIASKVLQAAQQVVTG